MSNLRDQVWIWYQQGEIAAEQMSKAITLAGRSQAQVPWREVIGQLLLWFGVLFFAAGVIIFFAFNWQELSKFGKFALVQSLLLLSTLGYAWFRWQERETNPYGLGATKANAALLALSFMIGALLALVGQTYQTGADPWQLFAIWSLCLLPLAWLAGFDLLWVMFLALVNLSLALYLTTWPLAWWWLDYDTFPLAAISVCNGLVYIVFYGANKLAITRCNAPICQSLCIVIALSSLTWYGCWQAIDIKNNASFIFYGLYAVTVFVLSRFVLHQLLPLALVCFSVIAVSTVWLTMQIFVNAVDEMGVFLFLTLYLVGTAAGASMWLTKVRALFDAAQSSEEVQR